MNICRYVLSFQKKLYFDFFKVYMYFLSKCRFLDIYTHLYKDSSEFIYVSNAYNQNKLIYIIKSYFCLFYLFFNWLVTFSMPYSLFRFLGWIQNSPTTQDMTVKKTGYIEKLLKISWKCFVCDILVNTWNLNILL